MNIVTAAFTRNGIALAMRLAAKFGGRVFAPERLCVDGVEAIDEPLSVWAGRYFHDVDAMIFVSACGIAVRSVAQHVTSKMNDPAIIVIDEAAEFVIPILSGHVGGANDLARGIAGFLGAQVVITTATDVNNIPAVDEWAVKHDCMIQNPEAIKHISGAMLEGNSIGIAVTDENIPAPFPVTLWLRPKVLVLGAGCNSGTDSGEFERSALDFLDSSGVSVLSLKALASIDLKSREPAMLDFAARHNIPFMTFTATQLQALPGKFTASELVRSITGTDNVCERAAIMASGEGAALLRSKCVYGGITFALSRVRSKNHDITA